MSASSILTSLTSEVGTLLGASWSELDYIYDIEKNNFKSNKSRYGIGTRGASSTSGTNKAVTMDHIFFVTLTSNFTNRSSDAKERVALSELYDKIELISKVIFQKKLNNASVLLVSNLDYDEPSNPSTGTIALTVNVTVKYRNITT